MRRIWTRALLRVAPIVLAILILPQAAAATLSQTACTPARVGVTQTAARVLLAFPSAASTG